MQKEPIQEPVAANTDDSPSTQAAGQPGRPAPKATRRLASDDIFAGAIEVEIDHNGMLYRLRRTSLGKLILTK